VLPDIVKKCLSLDTNTHHGALLATAQVVHAVAKSASANHQWVFRPVENL